MVKLKKGVMVNLDKTCLGLFYKQLGYKEILQRLELVK